MSTLCKVVRHLTELKRYLKVPEDLKVSEDTFKIQEKKENGQGQGS